MSIPCQPFTFRRRSWRSGLLAFFLLFLSSRIVNSAPLEPSPRLLSVLEQVRNGHYTEALEAARGIAAENAAHDVNDPLPLLLEAQAQFDLIFCQTGHITATEIWHLSDPHKSPLDPLFFRAVSQASDTSERLKKVPATAALGHFYDGTAHGLRARLSTLREQTLPSGREGKSMREELMTAAALDKSLVLEASVGLGLYDYYADSLSAITKLFRFILFIPGGNAERGITALRNAAEAQSLARFSGANFSQSSSDKPSTAILLQPEARWELARIVGVREGHHDEAVRLLIPLVESYPDNALYALLTTLEAEGMGNLQLANHYAQKAAAALPRMEPSCRPKLEPAIRDARLRILEAIRVQNESPQ
jgi:hypothetical protein